MTRSGSSPLICPHSSDPAVRFWGEGDQGQTDLKPNNKISSFLLVYTLESVHCGTSSRCEHQPGKDGQTQVSLGWPRAAVRFSCRANASASSCTVILRFFLTTPSNQSRKDLFFVYAHKDNALCRLDRQVSYFSKKSTSVRYFMCVAVSRDTLQLSGTGQVGHASVAWRRDRDYE